MKAFEAVLPQIMRAKALVIDVRGNGGGSTDVGDRILAYLTPEPLPHAISLARDNNAAFRDSRGMVVWAPPLRASRRRRARAPGLQGRSPC